MPLKQPAAVPPATSNRILRLLTAEERTRLTDSGEMRELMQGEVLQAQGEPIERIFFPLSGVLSLLAVMSTGQAVEVSTIGREGFAGLPVFLGAKLASTQTLVQVGGRAVEVPAVAFRKEMAAGGRLAIILARYAELVFAAAAQSTACGRLHTVEQRTARAILTWHDRLESDRLPVTQDALAEALGVRRASVTVAISAFAKAGAVKRGRGRLYLNHRRRLEGFACECYQTVEDAFAREIQ